jgi:hypothetical protein
MIPTHLPVASNRIFLLSPANASGERARMVLNDRAQFELAVQLRREGARIADVFAFVSGLYFRGKVTYARAFSSPPGHVPGALVITPGRGLLPVDTVVTLDTLREMANVPIDLRDNRYLEPLARDAQLLNEAAGSGCDIVLLGSIATAKYVQPLLEVFGDRLLFPSEFVGRGDMSRGGLLLRCSRAGEELSYVPVRDANRHGPRPPKLPKLKR